MRVERTAWIDCYSEDGRSAVFVGGNVVVLSELASHLVTLVEGPTELAAVTEGLVARFGRPDGEAEALTRSAVAELVAADVLVEAP